MTTNTAALWFLMLQPWLLAALFGAAAWGMWHGWQWWVEKKGRK